MDKNVMNDVKNNQIVIHRRVGEMSEFQRSCGLRICGGNAGYAAPINGYEKCELRKFEFFSISCMWDGYGKFWSEETGEVEINAPSFVMVAPNVLNRYGGINGKQYIEDAISFYGPVADNFLRLGIFKTGVFPTTMLRRIPQIWEKEKIPSLQSRINAFMELQKLIVDIYNERLATKAENNVIARIIRELEKNIGRWYQVEELAEMTEMSISTFRRKFKQATGVMPKRYIEELKIHHAANDLINSDKKISRIAAGYGYFDPYHFSRRFKMIMGCSPEQYRSAFAGK